jgi:hypothetical protein
MAVLSPEWEGLAAKAAELGPLRAQFGPRRWLLLVRVVAWSLPLVGIGLLAFWILSNLNLFLLAAQPQIKAGVDWWKALRMGVGGLLLILGYILMVARVLRNWGNRVWVFAEGFVYLKGRQILVYRWDEIAAVRHENNIENNNPFALIFKGPYSLTVRPYEGPDLTLNPYLHKAKELGDLMERETLQSRLARDRANLEESPAGQNSARGQGEPVGPGRSPNR